MFSLSVTSLDGICYRLPVGVDDTLRQVREQLEQGLPPFTEVRLFHGEQELLDGDSVEVRLSAVKTQSPSKALEVVESFMNLHVMRVTGQDFLLAHTAAEALSEMEGDWSAHHCERLLKILNDLDSILYHSTVDYSWDLEMEKLRATLGLAFGRCCGDPAPYISRLIEVLLRHSEWGFAEPNFGWTAVALAEIAERSQGQLGEHCNKLLEFAEGWFDLHPGGDILMCPRSWFASHYGALRLLGQVGSMAHESILQLQVSWLQKCLCRLHAASYNDNGAACDEEVGGAGHEEDYRDEDYSDLEDDGDEDYRTAAKFGVHERMGVNLFQKLLDEATSALAFVRAKEQVPPYNVAETTADFDSETSFAADNRLEKDHNDDGKRSDDIEAALARSTDEIAEQENAYVAEAMMRSKIDAPVSNDGIIVLRLKRVGRADEVNQALLTSPHLSGAICRVEQAGCEVLPTWTAAKLFVPMTQEIISELGLDLGAHHIVVHRDDYEHVVAALHELPCRRRPTVSLPPTGMAEVITEGGQLLEQMSGTPGEVAEEFPIEILEIERTFYNITLPKDVSEVSCMIESAPCGSLGKKQPLNPRRWKQS